MDKRLLTSNSLVPLTAGHSKPLCKAFLTSQVTAPGIRQTGQCQQPHPQQQNQEAHTPQQLLVSLRPVLLLVMMLLLLMHVKGPCQLLVLMRLMQQRRQHALRTNRLWMLQAAPGQKLQQGLTHQQMQIHWMPRQQLPGSLQRCSSSMHSPAAVLQRLRQWLQQLSQWMRLALALQHQMRSHHPQRQQSSLLWKV